MPRIKPPTPPTTPGDVKTRPLSIKDIADICAGAYPPTWESPTPAADTIAFTAVPPGVWRVFFIGGGWVDTEGSMPTIGITRNGIRHIAAAAESGGDLAGVPTRTGQVTLKHAFIGVSGDIPDMTDEYGSGGNVAGSLGYVDVIP